MLGGADERVDAIEAPGVAEERPRLACGGADEHPSGRTSAFGDGREDPPFRQ
jgi:hypothetical protein